jgi:hypothetical protein
MLAVRSVGSVHVTTTSRCALHTYLYVLAAVTTTTLQYTRHVRAAQQLAIALRTIHCNHTVLLHHGVCVSAVASSVML